MIRPARELRKTGAKYEGHDRTPVRTLALLATFALPVGVSAQESPGSREGWDFKFKDFVIGAWLGPDGTPGEVQVYQEAGFNVVMVGRYMAHGEYALPERVARELDLVHQFGLGAMIDTYTQNDKPWGGVIPPAEGTHHSSSLEELQWIHARFGNHPALIGYMLGDDQGTMSPQLIACTQFLREKASHLMPWICGWVPARELAAHHNPFVNWQIYPTLYNTGDTAEQQARSYCVSYNQMRQDCLQYDRVPWPMFNASGKDVSDSLLRFPIYAALAYGAQGLWYFTYRIALNNGEEGKPGHETYAAAQADVKPNWFVAQQANHRVLAYGPRLLGSTSQGLFSTGWETPGAVSPHSHKIVPQMSENLLVGILTKPGQSPLAMVVDKRVNKTPEATPPREVEVTFTDLVKRVRVLDTAAEQTVEDNTVALSLAGGEGLLLLLEAAPGQEAELETLALPEEIQATWEPRIRARAPWFEDPLEVSIQSQAPGVEVRYTLDGSAPTAAARRYDGPFTLTETTTVQAIHHAPGPLGSAPNPAAGPFVIGGSRQHNRQGFDGFIDEVRVFTFAPGQFGWTK